MKYRWTIWTGDRFIIVLLKTLWTLKQRLMISCDICYCVYCLMWSIGKCLFELSMSVCLSLTAPDLKGQGNSVSHSWTFKSTLIACPLRWCRIERTLIPWVSGVVSDFSNPAHAVWAWGWICGLSQRPKCVLLFTFLLARAFALIGTLVT